MTDQLSTSYPITASSTRAQLLHEIDVLKANAVTVAARVEWLVAQVVNTIDVDDKVDPMLIAIRSQVDAWCEENSIARAEAAALLIAAVVEDLGVDSLGDLVSMVDH